MSVSLNCIFRIGVKFWCKNAFFLPAIDPGRNYYRDDTHQQQTDRGRRSVEFDECCLFEILIFVNRCSRHWPKLPYYAGFQPT